MDRLSKVSSRSATERRKFTKPNTHPVHSDYKAAICNNLRISLHNAHVDAGKVHPHQMKPATIIGALLILLAIIGFATGGISFTHQKKDVDLGPIQVSHETKDTFPISPILSTLALVAGIGLVAVGVKGR